MRSLLGLLPKPSHYIGLETNACYKDLSSIDLHIALAFPDTYEVAMSYLGHKILYSLVNAKANWYAERVFAPLPEAGAIIRKHQKTLATLESYTPLKDLHGIGFAITHELCYTNILYMLDLAQIPRRRSQRPDNLAQCPLIFAGGSTAIAAEPITPFFDLLLLGDGEELLLELCQALEVALKNGIGRQQFLAEVKNIPGVYVPEFFDTQAGISKPKDASYRPARRVIADLNLAEYPCQQITPHSAIQNRLSLEIARGCTRSCRFCQAGTLYRPVRERKLENLSQIYDQSIEQTGFEEISLLSLSTGDFSGLKTLFKDLMPRCHSEQISLALPSLRVGSTEPEIFEQLASLRRSGCTLAPEAGSQRLRDVINKNIKEEDLLLHLSLLQQYGWRQVKLYFMIGLPTETDEDLLAILDLCRRARDVNLKLGRQHRLQISAAVSPFIPKPWTPFQWEAQLGLDELKRRIYFLSDAFKKEKMLTFNWHSPELCLIEGLLSRGKRDLADLIEKATDLGAIFCEWREYFNFNLWQQAFAECNLSEAKQEQMLQGFALDATLPWDHLEAGVTKEFLLRERTKALAGQITQDCRYHACQQCGCCDRPKFKSKLPHTTPNPENKEQMLAICNRLNFTKRDQIDLQEAVQNQANLETSTTKQNENLPKKDQQAKNLPNVASDLTKKAAQYCIWHTRLGGSTYFSQLELQAILERAFRRANLPLSFSQGFHPMPLLSFGRALPVGVESEAEFFYISLHKILAPQVINAKLSQCLPAGITLRAINPCQKPKTLNLAIAEVFRLTCQEEHLTQDFVEDFLSYDEFFVEIEGKKGKQDTDIRPYFQNISFDPDGSLRLVLDWSEHYLSPLTLCKALIWHEDLPADAAVKLKLRKIAQIFNDGSRFPQN